MQSALTQCGMCDAYTHAGISTKSCLDGDDERRHEPKPGVAIFIGGMARSHTNEGVREWFAPFGDVLEVRIAHDKRRKNRCRGYGLVRFRTREQANAAVQGMRSFEFQEGCFLHALPSDENRTLFVGGLTESWDPKTVKATLLNAFPGMRSMISIADKTNSSKTKPFCFVEFYERAQASVAYSTYHCTPAATATKLELLPPQYVNEGSSNTFSSSSSIEDLAKQIQGLSCSHNLSPGAIAPCMTAQAPATELPAAAGTAVVLKQEGTELKFEWADPLRLYIHMHGSGRQHRGATGNKCTAKKSAINKLGHRRTKDVALRPERKQQLLPQHHTSRYTQLPPVEPTWWQHQFSTETHLPMQRQLPLPVLYRDAAYNSHCLHSQPYYQCVMIPPYRNGCSDFGGLSQPNHQLQMLQVQHDDYMAQYGRWT